jgi:hypothetical protein
MNKCMKLPLLHALVAKTYSSQVLCEWFVRVYDYFYKIWSSGNIVNKSTLTSRGAEVFGVVV